jgi:hypothetical protein
LSRIDETKVKNNIKSSLGCQALVAHNPSYSGGRNQEDHGSKPVGEIGHETVSQKKSITEKGWWSGSRHRP